MVRHKKIKCVVFDLDQTILNHIKGETTGLKKIYELFLKDKAGNFQRLYDDFIKINTALWVNLKNGNYDTGFIIKNRFKYLTKLYGVYDQVKLIQKIYSKQYISYCTPFIGAKILLERLHKMRVPMAIGSNGFIGCQTDKLHQHELKQYFFKCYYGNKAPFCKPYQYFFRHIVKDIGVKAHEILFVGDSEKDDISPALEVGMKALHINQNYLDGENLAHEKILVYIKDLF